MNEVNILNIGGIDYNIDDQLARDVIAHSENGLDPQSNLPISSRHYDEGDYLIGQDRLYYEVTSDIEIGDVIAEGVNVRATIISEELVRLKNQSSIAVIQSIAKVESTALSSRNYTVGQYFYWDFGLTAGLYETIATITSGDAFSVGVNIRLANKIIDMVDGLSDAYNITGAKNLCPNNASDTVTTDITWDVMSDGSIQVSGTPASERVLTICEDGVVLPAGTYTLTTGTNRVCLQAKNKANGTVLGRSNGASYPATFTIATETTVTFLLYTIGGTSSMNVRAFPMCRVASITDESYVPYAMTNRQLTSEIGNLSNYSTTEHLTGKYWIDGKPIYRKVVNFGMLPNNTNKVVNHNISGISNWVSFYGITWNNEKTAMKLPHVDLVTSYSVALWVTSTVITIGTGQNRNEFANCYVVLEYTKT